MARILIIDDEPSIRLLYRDTLEEDGHAISEAASGDEAAAQLADAAFDLIVLDIRLRDESGLNLLQSMVHASPHVPVILCSAYASYQDDYTSWLADSYVVKSSDPEELAVEVRKVLATRTRRAGA